MGSVTLKMAVIEPRPMRARRMWFRWRNRFLPPIVQLALGMLPMEGEL